MTTTENNQNYMQVGQMKACGHCEPDKYSAVELCPCKCHTTEKEEKDWIEKINDCFLTKRESPNGIPVVQVNPDTLKLVVQGLLSHQQEELVKFLEAVEKEKWDDCVHCTCLGYATALLKGEEPEEYNRIKNLIKEQSNG